GPPQTLNCCPGSLASPTPRGEFGARGLGADEIVHIVYTNRRLSMSETYFNECTFCRHFRGQPNALPGEGSNFKRAHCTWGALGTRPRVVTGLSAKSRASVAGADT